MTSDNPVQKSFRDTIIDNGWTQGSTIALNDSVSPFIVCTSVGETIKSKYLPHLLLLSQDCDIVSESEANVECLLMKKQKKVAPSLLNGLNPRKLQLEAIQGIIWEFKADDIYIVSKELLLSQKVDEQIDIPEEQLTVVKQWKANRYTRKGLPERFVELTRHILMPSKEENPDCLVASELITTFSAYISSIRVYCKESAGGTSCGFILLYKHKKCADDTVDLTAMEELFEECLLDKVREIEGIFLINDDESEDGIFNAFNLTDIMSDMDFPIGATQMFPRFYFDYVSFGDSEDESDMDEA